MTGGSFLDGENVGYPIVAYRDTEANVEALGSPAEGMLAWATDTDKFGFYDGAAWQWVDPANPGSLAWDNIITVGASGCDYTSIQSAVTAASSGDALLIMPGTYTEDVTITDLNLGLFGFDGANTILDGQLYITATGGSFEVYIYNFKVNESGGGTYALKVDDSGGANITVTAKHCRFLNTGSASTAAGVLVDSGTVALYDVTAQGGAATRGSGLEVNGGSCGIVSGTLVGSQYQIYQTGGTASVGVGVSYDPTQFSGTVTRLSTDEVEDQLGGAPILADGTVELTADWDAGAHEIRAETLESDVATGTAPLTIASTTLVTNLNADQLDGYDYDDLPAWDNVLIVSASGAPYTSIQSAHDAASSGDAILVMPGTYSENLTFTKSINLIGLGPREGVIIDGSSGGNVFTCTTASLTLRLENLTFYWSGASASYINGLRLGGAGSDIDFVNVKVYVHNTDAGGHSRALYADSTPEITFWNSHLHASGTDGRAVRCAGATVHLLFTYIYGNTYTLYRSAGTLNEYSCNYDWSKISGTVGHLNSTAVLNFGQYDALLNGRGSSGAPHYDAVTLPYDCFVEGGALVYNPTAPQDGSNYWTISLRRLSDGAIIWSTTTSGDTTGSWNYKSFTSLANNDLTASTHKGLYIAFAITAGSPGAISAYNGSASIVRTG